MARPEKITAVESLVEIFQQSRCVVLNDFTGLNVEKLSKLRTLCRENNVEYRVVKNTLAIRSLKDTEGEELVQYLEGPTALAISRESENIPAKILAQFAGEYEAPRFKAALVEGRLLDAAQVIELSKLPGREELLSTVLAGIKAPANSFVNVLMGTVRNLVYALNAIVDKGNEKESQ
jgi:large subunit ribosomal protein L10